MDKTERETHDFMNVESFSQLPFIRPAPAAIKEKGIRLFGIEFGNAGNTTSAAAATTTTTDESESAETTTNNNAFELDSSSNKDNNNSTENNGGESNRRFECHYCCRNFPTSQALGGHQNAHKRERQHAKRAHLQSAMVHGTFSDPHQVYGLMNYRFNSTPTSPMPYTSWNNSNSLSASSNLGGGGRFYHGTSSYSHPHHHHHHQQQQQQQQPINGSPLASWRIPNGNVQGSSNPSLNHERSLLQQSLPLFSGEEINMRASSQVGGSSSQNRYVYDSSKRSVHDHVSLDLHL